MTTQDLDIALQEYEHWRTQEAGFSIKTWAGEVPGLLGFIDAMRALDIHETEDLDAGHVGQWWAELTVGAATRVTRLAQLRSFLGYCQSRGWMERDPSVFLRAPRQAERVDRLRLDAVGLLNLIEVAGCPRDRALIALAVNLALRGGEIARLTVRDVDLDAGTVLVRVDKTKQQDLMPVTEELRAELHAWLTHYDDTCAALSPQSLLIPSQYVDWVNDRTIYRHTRPIGKPYKPVQDALDELGYEVKGEGVHTIRRSVARLYFDDVEQRESFDSALLATMTLLHHARPETTLKYIGTSRALLARERHLKGKPFLTRLAGRPQLRLAQ